MKIQIWWVDRVSTINQESNFCHIHQRKKYKICEFYHLELVVGSGEQDYNHAFNRSVPHCCKETMKFVKFVRIWK